ncbi:hypothetical protein CR513_14896, partial [Mucuna pruriens]
MLLEESGELPFLFHLLGLLKTKEELFGFNSILGVYQVVSRAIESIRSMPIIFLGRIIQSSSSLRKLTTHIHVKSYLLVVMEMSDKYYDWELKVMQNLDCLNCDDYTKVRLIALSFKGYALIWWNEISLQCRGLKRESIDSWEELRKKMRD